MKAPKQEKKPKEIKETQVSQEIFEEFTEYSDELPPLRVEEEEISTLEFIIHYIRSFIWVALSSIIAYYAELPMVIFNNPFARKNFVIPSLICFVLGILQYLYLSIYVRYVLKVKEYLDYDDRIVISIGFFFLISAILMFIALLPIYGWIITPIIFFAFFMATVHVTSLVF